MATAPDSLHRAYSAQGGARRSGRKVGSQERHPHRDHGRPAALVALAAARAGERLVHVLGRDHPEGAGHPGIELDPLGSGRDLVADVVVVAGLTADYDAQTGDAREAPRLRTELGREWQLEGARDTVRVDRSLADPSELEPLGGPVQEALGDVLVEGRYADRELGAGERLALFVDELLKGSAPFSHAWNLSGFQRL